ncbi:hypothetical protein ACOMHN_046133 [Nucella lapillus]
MADEGLQVNALLRRHHQLKRWEDSETNRESGSPRPSSKKVKFQDGCVFLAACSSGDRDEVKRLLERGADINTANVDGLTALHQACIDDNLDMVEFLVEEEADVDVCDNEGWTPLHATASCGFTEIARYLIKRGADVAAVNNDGDLAIDIAEDEEMEKLLQEEMDKKGVDADAARREEEDCMLADANQWLQTQSIEDTAHPKTGATALHVAAAKGYITVMRVLLQAGVDINSCDADGWTPLHAAVHWGQEESCQILVDGLCDMDIKNNAGHTVFDVADKEMLHVLEDLKKKQASLRTASESNSDIIHSAGHSSKRRSSVTRMSSGQKQSVITKTSEEERATMDANLSHLSSPKEEEEKKANSSTTQDAETERRNELNKQSSLISQPQSPRTRPPSLSATLDAHKPEMPKIDEVSEQEKPSPTPTPSTTPPSSVTETTSTSEVAPTPPPPTTTATTTTTTDSSESVVSSQEDLRKNHPGSTSTDELMQSWRRSLRKTGSTSMVHEQMNENEDKSLPRSSSSPRLALDNRIESLQERLNARRPLSSTSALSTTTSTPSSTSDTSTDSRPGDRYSWSGSHLGYYSRSGYKTYYQRQQEQREQQEREALSGSSRITRPFSSISAFSSPSSPSSSSSSSVSPLTSTTTATTTIVTTSNATNSVFRRSYEPPKRDEETETQRKARAKHARQTRRSTQGVSLEDLEKAEEVLRQGDSNKTATEGAASSSTSSIRDTASTTTATTTVTTTPRSALSSSGSGLHNDRTSGLSSRESLRDETSPYRRRNLEDRLEGDSTKTSFRRPREDRDSATNNGTSSPDVTSTYVPRSQRNALSTSDINSSLSSSSGVSRSASLRSKLRNGEAESTPDDDRKKEETRETKKAESPGTEKEEKKETAAIKSRRKRQERRSTGINYVPGEEEKGKENKPDDEEKEESAEGSSRLGRYSSSDASSDSTGRNRPVSYSEYSRSTSSLDDFKKLYEEEREENGRLKKELDQCKKELLEAKSELDKMLRRSDSSRNTDTSDKREKRALERKVSEYEEELKQMEKLKGENKKLKEENRALTRVVAKLSR